MKVHLVDGTYELFRAFYSWPSALGHRGREVGASRGLLRSFRQLLATEGVTHVACAFDHRIESFRNDLFAGYKTGAGIEPKLLEQFPLAEQLCSALGIVTWPMVEFEADDALATAAARFAKQPEVDQVVICSPDKDMMQCVQGQRVVCWDRMRDKVYDEPAVVEKFGVSPGSIADYLALVGDAADGIPGVPRWGQKSAAAVLSQSLHIELIPPDFTKWSGRPRGARALAEQLEAHRQQALLYKQLATLRLDVPLPEAIADLRYQGARRDAMQQVCEQIADFSWMDSLAWRA